MQPCYTELGTIIPESGGEFIYILRIYGSVPAFFAALTFAIVVKPMGISATALSIAEYTTAPFYPDCPPASLIVKCTAAAVILVVTTVNILNVQAAIRIQAVFLVAKVLALMLIVSGGGVVTILQGRSIIDANLNVERSFKGTELSLSAVGMAFYQYLWSYAGWYNLNYVTEELKRPEVKNTPWSHCCVNCWETCPQPASTAGSIHQPEVVLMVTFMQGSVIPKPEVVKKKKRQSKCVVTAVNVLLSK